MPHSTPSHTRHQQPSQDPRVLRSLFMGRLLDSVFRIPGTRIRFGLDPLLGLLPGLGDALAALLGGYIVWAAIRAGANWMIIGHMLFNIAIDAIVGAVPVAGTIFDVAFKAHKRNAQMLAQWAASPAAIEVRERRLWIAVAASLLTVFAIAVATLAFGLWALFTLLGWILSIPVTI